KLDHYGRTAFHYVVGRYKDNEVVRDILMEINSELLVTTVTINGANPVHVAAQFDNTQALKMILNFNPNSLFIPDAVGNLPIHYALSNSAIKTFLYMFKQMRSYKVEFDIFLRGGVLKLLGQVIDIGLIDVAYDLINDYPSMATQVYHDITPLERIIRKPDLFYSETDYNLYQRFVYRYVENQETPNKDKFVAKHTSHLDDLGQIMEDNPAA
nr:hypothetical protein [Tanacetum cinerariifolium]